jgi:hypothetical protein
MSAKLAAAENTIVCHGLDRVVPLGNGQASFVLYEKIVMPDGSIERRSCGQVIGPLECISDAIAVLLTGMMDAGLNRAVAAVKSRLGHVFH